MVGRGGKSRGSQNRDPRYGCFSIAGALGRSAIRSGGPGYSQLIFAARAGWPLLMEWGGEYE